MAYSSYMTFNSIAEDTYNLQVKNIERSILPTVDNRFVKINNSDGSYYFGANLGNRVISITFEMINETSKTDMHSLVTQIAGWLFPIDRQAKILTISDEPAIQYYAQIDGDTDFEELFLYGEVTIDFVCSDPFKYSTSLTYLTMPILDRSTAGFNGDFETIAAYYPRYSIGNYGVMIETTGENIINNSGFADPTAEVPDYYAIKSGGDSGTIDTTDEVVELTSPGTWATTTSYYGIVEEPGEQHVVTSTSSKWSVGVWYRVTGDAQFRIRADALDSGYGALPSSYSSIGTATSWTYFKWENQNITNQYIVGIGFELYANGDTGNTGTVEIKYPNFEEDTFVHESILTTGTTSTTTQADDLIWDNTNTDIFDPSNHTFGIGLTIKPFFNSTDQQVADYEKYFLSMYEDANNFLHIYLDDSLTKFTVYYAVDGSVYAESCNSFSFDRFDEIKLYVTRNSSGVKIEAKHDSTTYDSGYTASVPADDIEIDTIYAGQKNGNTNQCNSILYNLTFEITPDSSAYFAGTNTPNFNYLSGYYLDLTDYGYTTKQYPTIQLTFTDNVTNLKITNEVTGDYIYILYSFGSGDIVTINLEARTITRNGSNAMQYLDFVNSRWFGLEDYNSLIIDTADVNITMYNRERFI